MGYKENDIVNLFTHVQEARTKARVEGQSGVVLEPEASEEEEDDGDEEEEDDEEGEEVGDFNIHVREGREDEATSRGLGDAPIPSRAIPDVGEATTTSTPSFQATLDHLQSNIFFPLDIVEAHGSFEFQYLEAKVDSLSHTFTQVVGVQFLLPKLLRGLLPLLLRLMPLHPPQSSSISLSIFLRFLLSSISRLPSFSLLWVFLPIF